MLLADIKKLRSLEGIKVVVEYIATLQHDPEGAHRFEDGLYEHVLGLIAASQVDPVEAAKILLLTKQLDFERWYG